MYWGIARNLMVLLILWNHGIGRLWCSLQQAWLWKNNCQYLKRGALEPLHLSVSKPHRDQKFSWLNFTLNSLICSYMWPDYLMNKVFWFSLDHSESQLMGMGRFVIEWRIHWTHEKRRILGRKYKRTKNVFKMFFFCLLWDFVKCCFLLTLSVYKATD